MRAESGFLTRLAFCSTLLAVLAGCGPAITSTPLVPVPAPRLGFSDSLQPLMDAAVPLWGDQLPESGLETRLGSSATTWDDLVAGQIDAAMVLGGPDGGRCQGTSPDWWSTVVGFDGLALVVNRETPLPGLSLEQVRDVFEGRIWSWEMVGGPATEVAVVSREADSDVRTLFEQLVMREHRVTLTAVVMPDSDTLLNYVAIHRGAIGYVAAGFADERVEQLAIEGVYPSPEALTDHSYPLYTPICLSSLQEPTGTLRQFASWLLSRDGQAVIGRRYGRVR